MSELVCYFWLFKLTDGTTAIVDPDRPVISEGNRPPGEEMTKIASRFVVIYLFFTSFFFEQKSNLVTILILIQNPRANLKKIIS